MPAEMELGQETVEGVQCTKKVVLSHPMTAYKWLCCKWQQAALLPVHQKFMLLLRVVCGALRWLNCLPALLCKSIACRCSVPCIGTGGFLCWSLTAYGKMFHSGKLLWKLMLLNQAKLMELCLSVCLLILGLNMCFWSFSLPAESVAGCNCSPPECYGKEKCSLGSVVCGHLPVENGC
jgi:hypothetical protein